MATPISVDCVAQDMTTHQLRSYSAEGTCEMGDLGDACQSSTASNVFGPPTPQDSASVSHSNHSQTDTANGHFSNQDCMGLDIPWKLPDAVRERLAHAFYKGFYPAHPMLVPQTFYDAQLYPQYLDLVVCYIGQHYGNPIAEATGLHDAVHLAMADVDERTVHRIQALLMYAILLHARHDPAAAEAYLARAARIAVFLGINDPSFAKDNAGGYQVVEESLRRTWWELYVVEVYVAALHRHPTCQMQNASTTPLLPSSQAAYESGRCDSTLLTLRTFEDRVFVMNSAISFPTFCYRIEAARLLERSLAFANASGDGIENLDSALASWQYTLPDSQGVDASESVDEMMFQAHCFVHCTSVFLHFPRSDLPMTIPSAAEIACAQRLRKLDSTSTHHAVRAIAASKSLSDLATLPCPLERHSPLFACGLILGCVVQLAAASGHYHPCGKGCLQQHRDRIVLMLGTLRRLGSTWKVAENAAHHLGTVAQAVFVFQNTPETDTIAGDDTTLFLENNESIDDFAQFTGMQWLDMFTMSGLQDQ